MKRELTSFQTECETQLAAALERVGKQVANRRIDGISETYITGNIKDQDIAFWIYADGADFQAPNRHQIFERPDYASLDELAEKFIGALVQAVDRQCTE